MAYDAINAIAWLHLIQNKKEPLTFVITTHLFVEYGLNYLIESNCKNPSKILEDNNRWTFAMKLEICYQMNLIEDYLYLNIRKLNDIRNKYGHNLTVNFREVDLNFEDPQKRVNLAKWKNKDIMSLVPTDQDIIDAMIWVGALTFEPLHNKIVGRNEINIKPSK